MGRRGHFGGGTVVPVVLQVEAGHRYWRA
jgi:hypothetical protein